MRIHYFDTSVSTISLPAKFTYPFHYTPHPLCEIAADEVRRYLTTRADWTQELQGGKMFGVLIVETQDKKIGFLAAFSGNLAQCNDHAYFVPPVFDLLSPTGFFRVEEENISAINRQIKELENTPDFIVAQQQLSTMILRRDEEIATAKIALKEAKKQRESRRKQTSDPVVLQELTRESQFQKAELKRLERRLEETIDQIRQQFIAFDSKIEALKQERKMRSAQLQQQLFNQFRFLNARGEEQDLCTIFDQTAQKTPPAGAGECAGPKLLHYAYRNRLKPLAMAEFWWGDSPKTEIRHHGHYYPACKGKCEPILGHMLQGLEVDENPLLADIHKDISLEILFEDEWMIAVYKPAGMLSVPGKGAQTSVYSLLNRQFPTAEGILSVHRLDMPTSGILLLAKTKEVHKKLQAQFRLRSVKKRYIALLEGISTQKEGCIELPIIANIADRPRQMVSFEYGKQAITHYRITGIIGNRSRVEFYPLTGRTHQLRVHAAHSLGLDMPIVGDELYGQKADRLYLHAEMLEFEHPVTGTRIYIEKKSEF